MPPLTSSLTFTTLHGQLYFFLRDAPDRPKKFVDVCIENEFSLSLIADSQGVSVIMLRRSFSKFTGISPKAWMTQHRVLIAVRMLRQGVQLPEIRKELAYHDYPHMAKEFKTVLGVAPKAMQERLIALQENLWRSGLGRE